MAKFRPFVWLRRLGIGVLILLLLLVLVWVFRWPLFGGLIKEQVVSALRAEGVEAEIGGMSGSLLTGVEVTDVRIADGPYLRSAEVRRISASYSIFGLLTGRGDWLEEVTVQGLRAVADLEKAPPPSEPEVEEPDEPGAPFRIGSVTIEEMDVTVHSGEDLLVLKGGFLRAKAGEGDSIGGEFGSADFVLTVDGVPRRAEAARGEFRFEDDVLRIDPLVANGKSYPEVLRADLGAIADSRVSAYLALPLFDGRVKLDADLDLSGDDPAGTVTASIENLDLQPFIGGFPDLPLTVGRIDGTIEARDLAVPADADLIRRIVGQFDLRISDASFEGRSVRGIALTGKLADGVATFDGSISDPGLSVGGTADLKPEDPVLDVRLTVPSLDLGRLDLVAEGEPITGTLRDLTAEAKGPVSALDFAARLSLAAARWGEIEIDRVSLAGSGTTEEVRIEELLVESGDDRLEASARLTLEPEFRFADAEAELTVPSLAVRRSRLPAEIRDELPIDLAGTLHLIVRSASGSPEAPRADVELTGLGVVAEGNSIAKLLLRGVVETSERFVLSQVRAEGEDPLPTLDLRDVALSLTEAGPDVTVGTLLAEKYGLTVRSREGAPVRYGADGTFDADLVIDPFDLASLRAELFPDLDLGGRVTGGVIRAAGTIERPVAEIRLDAEALHVTPRGLSRIDAPRLALAASYRDRLARLSELLVLGEGWSVKATGEVPFDTEDPEACVRDDLTASLTIEALPLPLLGALADAPLEQGVLAADLVISGTPEAPVASGSLTVAGGVLGPLGPSAPRIEGIGARLRVEEVTPASGRFFVDSIDAAALGAKLSARNGSLVLRDGRLEGPRLDLTVSGVDLAKVSDLLALETPVRGRVPELRVGVRPGPKVSFELEGRELAYQDREGLSLDLAGSIGGGEFSITRGMLIWKGVRGGMPRTLTVEEARIPFDLRLNPLVAGPVPDRPLSVRVTSGRLDIADFVPPDADFRASGRLEVGLLAAGTLRTPVVRALAALTGGVFRAPGVPPVDGLTGDIEMSVAPDVVTIKGLRGALGDGDFAIKGQVKLLDGVPTLLDVDITAEDALLLREEGLSLRSDLALKLSGTGLADLLLSGEVNLTSLRYTANVDYLESGGTSPPSLPTTEDPALGSLKLKVAVIAPKDSIRVRNNFIDADLAGRLDIGGTVAVPRPKGRLRFLYGKLSLPTVKMNVEQAAVEFRPDQPLRPFLEARANARVSGYEVLVDAYGPGDRLTIDLASTPVLTRSNIVALLTTGVIWENVNAESLGGMAANVLIHRVSSDLSGGDGESSTLSDIIERFEVDFENRSATFRLLDRLYLRASQDDPLNYGLDLIFRMTFP